LPIEVRLDFLECCEKKLGRTGLCFRSLCGQVWLRKSNKQSTFSILNISISDNGLGPQNKFENLTSAVERLTALTHKFSGIEKLDETAWTAYLCEHDADVKGTFANDLLDEEERNKSVQWFCSKNFISMTLQLPLSEIELTTTGINSSLLRGTWWGGVSKVETFEVGGLTQFNLDVDGDWPYLIRGGNPDGTSCYFLACIAQSLNEPEFVRMWLLLGAIRESRSAMTSYATLLYDANQVAAGCHWLSRCVLRFGDDQCAFLLAMLLLNPSVKYDTGLAEALLCSCCRNGSPGRSSSSGGCTSTVHRASSPCPRKHNCCFRSRR
jgi:hypothetical protein